MKQYNTTSTEKALQALTSTFCHDVKVNDFARAGVALQVADKCNEIDWDATIGQHRLYESTARITEHYYLHCSRIKKQLCTFKLVE